MSAEPPVRPPAAFPATERVRPRRVPPAGDSSKITMRSVLRNLEFRALTIAQLSSLGGDQMARVALMVLVFNRTGSPFQAAIAYALSFVPAAIGNPLFAGHADRSRRKSVMIVCDLARAPLIALIAIPSIPLPLAFVLLSGVGLIEAPFEAARGALLPDVLPGEKYRVGYALSQICVQTAQVGGYAAAGLLLVAFSPSVLLLVDAASFLVSAALIARNVAQRPAAAQEHERDASQRWHARALDDARRTARLVLGNASLRWLVLLAWGSVTTSVSFEALGAPLAKATHAESWAVGFLLAAQPVGVILGALLATRVPASRGPSAIRLFALLSVLPLALGLLKPPLPVLLLIGLLSGCGASFNVLASAAFVARIPGDLRGRALAFVGTGMLLGNGFGVLIAGSIASVIDPRLAVAWIGLAGVALVSIGVADGLRPLDRSGE